MAEDKKLSSDAYGGISGKDYVPYVSASAAIPEVTIVSIAIGLIFAIIFAAANVYLGLKVGLTISAGIPSSILATGLLKGIFKRNNILEANFIQATAAMGESIAGGLIYTLPAIIMWGMQLKLSTIIVVTMLGGLLGIFFIVPFRRYLIVEEHGKLIYPESMAAAEVLVTGSTGGSGFKTIMTGLVGGGLYKLLSGGFGLWSEAPEWTIKPFQSTIIGIDTLASLIGVGYIVGIEVALYMLAGSLLAWFGLIPLIKYVGMGLSKPLFPSKALIANMDAWSIWSNYIRYVGAGAVAAGGFISLGKSLPTIINSFKSAMSGLNTMGEKAKRTDIDVPLTWVVSAAILVFLLSWLLPVVHVGPIGGILIVVFSFFFAVVSGRMVGIIGASNNPVSGMTIASLLFVTSILKVIGFVGDKGMLAAITAGAIICVAIAVAGGSSQSLKTTYIIGGTPKYVEISMYAGVVIAAGVAGYVILMLNNIYGMGNKVITAPQASLMSMVVKGVMTGQLPWALVLIGAALGVMVELMGLPVLPVALGIYLPIHLSTAIVIGGIVRVLVEKKFKGKDKLLKEQTEKGVLLSSGLVAGDALMGIIVAIFAALKINIGFGANLLPSITGSSWTAALMFIVLAVWLYRLSVKVDDKVSTENEEAA